MFFNGFYVVQVRDGNIFVNIGIFFFDQQLLVFGVFKVEYWYFVSVKSVKIEIYRKIEKYKIYKYGKKGVEQN